ncbi:hypothetical protein C2857_004036 [Epichloe festucae Fl1]|uniref:Uncharacterized protein n=1 Tax=Epichloe festucae (strain Fl1) TaxID=877507 RepID=A0A7S9KNZ8_EPIFF|nr:hypothetical protein C2857_004036 [Epichloe festucae Fl1]
MSSLDSVGTLLAEIANLIIDGLRIFSLSDKRHWGPDEYEQVQALEDALNQAKKDFQALCPLVNGQAQYEHDRKYATIRELSYIRSQYVAHVQLLKDWSRSGGPINPVWVRETHSLQQELHRAQCRAAGRIFTSLHESSQRCLGAFLVRRAQRNIAAKPIHDMTEKMVEKRQLEELGACTRIGSFDRFEEDVVFICDFCDGHLIWNDLENIPTERTPPYRPTGQLNDPHWQATGATSSGPEEKHVVFAPVAIANHIALRHGDWQATLFCPFCEEDSQQPQDKDDEEANYRPDDVFEDVAELQEHLEWQHAGSLPGASSAVLPANKNCSVM